MVRSQDSSVSLSDAGAEPVIADALDSASVNAAVGKIRPDVIINELTSLPKHYTSNEMKAAAERDIRVRLEGNKNLLAAAQQGGVRRFLVQSTGFWYAPGEGPADEGEGFAYGASPAVAAGAQRYAELESMSLSRPEFVGDQVRQQQVPIIGRGQGVWSWVHIDAADATAKALICAPVPYNIVDDSPSEQRVWLTACSPLRSSRATTHLRRASPADCRT
jgi:hypothetical protein